MKHRSDKETRFIAIIDEYKDVMAKVCYLYSTADASFEDLYQETLVNIWQGMESFRGDAKLSTWIYRTAINTCISWYRKHRRHSIIAPLRIEDIVVEPSDSCTADVALEDYRELYRLISMLGPIDKAIITLWLDEKTYDEIARIIGISQNNVAVRLYRIKEKLSQMAEKE